MSPDQYVSENSNPADEEQGKIASGSGLPSPQNNAMPLNAITKKN